MSKASQIIVLAEDQRHQGFVRRYLYRLGYTRHDVRPEPLPSGRGCGEQWVRERYARAVAAYRHRSASARTCLIVAIDADTGEVSDRARELEQALSQAGLQRRASEEVIVHLIPKRHVETWILCLNGRHVDESTDYKQQPGVEQLIGTAAIAFFDGSRSNVTPPDHWVPSLRLAIPEVGRLEPETSRG